MKFRSGYFAAGLVLAAASSIGAAESCVLPNAPKLLWQEPPPTHHEDWVCGPGGCAGKPAPPFHFVKAEVGGSAPKMDVRDANGRLWSVKFGGEVTPECFGSRFLTALGYFAEPTYCVADLRVQGLPPLDKHLRHAMKPDGTFALARLELRGQKDMEFLPHCTWAWNDNPFVGTHELAGLKIAMMLLSNWDTKDSRFESDTNTGVFRSTRAGNPVLLYSFFDWGASLGTWGGVLRRDQSDCVGFANDTPHFINSFRQGQIDWGFSGKLAEDIKAGVSPADIRWLLPHLERITPDQIRTGLIASGATPRQAGCWEASITDRIQQLKRAAR